MEYLRNHQMFVGCWTQRSHPTAIAYHGRIVSWRGHCQVAQQQTQAGAQQKSQNLRLMQSKNRQVRGNSMSNGLTHVMHPEHTVS